jgi:putative MATE family efflux protein
MRMRIQYGAEKMGLMPVGRLLISMSLPMVISMMVQALYNVVDSIFVARLSEDALTAVTLAFPIQNLMAGITAGTGVGVGTLISRALGAGDRERANLVAGNSILLIVFSWLLVLLFGLFGARWFISVQTDIAEITEMGTIYLRIVTILSLGFFGEFGFNRLLQATGRMRLAMLVQMTGAVTNIILDPILIFGLLGAPALGVAGAAYATVIGQLLGMLVAFLVNRHSNHDLRLGLQYLRLNLPIVGRVYGIGFPSILMMGIGSFMTFAMNRILIAFSSTAVALFGAYFKLQSFVIMPVFGMNNGMIPIIGYNYGAKKKARILGTYRYALLFVFCLMMMGLALFQIFPRNLLGFFDASGEMLQIGVPALRTISLSFILAGFCIVTISLFQALDRSIYSFLVSAARQLLVLVPAAYLFSLTGRLELVWYAFPLSELMSLTVTILLLFPVLRKLNRELPDIPPDI